MLSLSSALPDIDLVGLSMRYTRRRFHGAHFLREHVILEGICLDVVGF